MKKSVFLLIAVVTAFLLSGCRFVRIEEEDRKPVSYTVVEHSDIPEELSRIMEEKKGKRISAKLRNRGGSVPGKGIWPSDERRVQYSGRRTWRIRKRSFFYYETSGTKGSERSRSSLISFHCNKNPAPEKAGNFPGRQQEIRKSI